MRLTRGAVERAAERVLAGEPDPVIRYRMLRDVLGRDERDAQVRAARRQMLRRRQVRELAAQQQRDGSWGRLHSVDTKLKRRIGTTESGVERALGLGLTSHDELLRRAVRYLESVVRGQRRIPDPSEKNDRWPAGVRMFAGATLARIDPTNRALDEVWTRWAEVVSRVFHRGRFDAQAQVRAHAELHDVHDGVAYLALENRYAVALLGARASELPVRLRRAYGDWLWARPNGLGYVNVRCWPPPVKAERREIVAWLVTLDLLMRFDVCHKAIGRGIQWLWDQRGEDGLGDFGAQTPGLRLSADWRQRGRRAQDHSLAALALMSRFLSAAL